MALGQQNLGTTQSPSKSGGFLSNIGSALRANPEITGAIAGGLATEIFGGRNDSTAQGILAGFQSGKSIADRRRAEAREELRFNQSRKQELLKQILT